MAAPMIPPDHAPAFLAAHGWGDARILPLAGDASFRRYFRVVGERRQAVLMDAPPPHEDPRPFIAVAEWLCEQGMSAPAILARDLAQVDAGDIVFDTEGLLALPRETRRRLLVAALMWIGGAHYPPRRAELSGLLDALSDGRKATLAGCLLVPGGGQCRLMREFAAVQELTGDPGQPWDRRWHLEGPAVEGGEIRALGPEGLAQCPGWRDTGRPRDTLLARRVRRTIIALNLPVRSLS